MQYCRSVSSIQRQVRPEPREAIIRLRGQAVILDADLAALYGVTVKRLNEQVKRNACLLYTSPSPRDRTRSRMPSSA